MSAAAKTGECVRSFSLRICSSITSCFLNSIKPGQISIPRKQSSKLFFSFCHGSESKDKFKIIKRVKIVDLCTFYNGVQKTGSISSINGFGKEPVLPSCCKAFAILSEALLSGVASTHSRYIGSVSFLSRM